MLNAEAMDPRSSRSHLIASLSHALDLTEGQAKGHAVRACLVGMEMAEALELPSQARTDLFYAILLKDAGGSANAAPVAASFGSDDHSVKRAMRLTDWSRSLPAARFAVRHAAMGGGPWRRLRHLARLARGGDRMARSFTRLRCTRGAEIALELGFSDTTATAIRNLDEHWDGGGHPEGLSGGTIPLLSRIAGLAQTVEVFLQEGGMRAVLEMVRERRGSWFDPELADIVLGWEDRKSWWSMVRVLRDAESLKGLDPGDRSRPLTESELDRVAQAFAEVIDAKSPFTYLHSRRVAEVVRLMARRLGLPASEVQKLYRAALLHDIGKLGISNRILDKRGPLSDDEWSVIQAHPRHTLAILQRVPAFQDIARTAAHHHERLDGSGYPWGVDGDRLDRGARALAVANVYEALTATRSYRKGIPVEEAMEILRAEAGTQLDVHMVDILAQCIDDEGGAGAVGSKKWVPAQERSA